MGHSQGGHAALVTGEMAAERLPDHELLGTVAIAPGAQLGEVYGDDIQVRIITSMVLFGAAAEDPSIDPADYLSPAAYEAAAGIVEEGCVGEIIDTMVPVAISPDFYLRNPLDDALGDEWLAANDPGQVVSDSPILLISGGLDAIVVPARTQALYERLCGLGQVVEFLYLPDADHETEPSMAADHISGWLADRLADEPAPDTCEQASG